MSRRGSVTLGPDDEQAEQSQQDADHDLRDPTRRERAFLDQFAALRGGPEAEQIADEIAEMIEQIIDRLEPTRPVEAEQQDYSHYQQERNQLPHLPLPRCRPAVPNPKLATVPLSQVPQFRQYGPRRNPRACAH